MPMMRHIIGLTLHAGEAALGFLSRLYLRNGLRWMEHFCIDAKLSLKAVTDGDPDEVDRLAGMAGVDAELFREWTPRKHGDDVILFRGETLTASTYRLNRFRVCPACLREDIARSELRQEMSAWCRSVWHVASIRTCPVHGLGLTDIGWGVRRRVNDFSGTLLPHLGELDAFERSAPRRRPTAFEDYLLGRLAVLPQTRAEFVDGLDFHVAAEFCEALGIVLQRGRTCSLRELTPDDRRDAAATGFEVAASGRNAIRSVLSRLQAERQRSTPKTGAPGTAFGVLYAWLSRHHRRPSHASLVELLRQHVWETTPVGRGSRFLGQAFPHRVLHSVQSASRETGAHPKRLRKALIRADLIAPAQATLPDDQTLFDAERAAPLLAAFATGLSLRDIETYAGCGRVQARLMLQAGFIVPVIHAEESDGWHLFAKADVDAFMGRLIGDARPIASRTGNMVDIPAAAKRVNRSAIDIVRLILDRKLPWVGLDPARDGYLSLLVDIGHVRSTFRQPKPDGLRLREAAVEIHATHVGVGWLVANGFLEDVGSDRTSERRTVITRSSLQEFQERFVSATAIARATSRGVCNAQMHLTRAGVAPVITREQAGNAYYRRDAVEPHIPRLSGNLTIVEHPKRKRRRSLKVRPRPVTEQMLKQV